MTNNLILPHKQNFGMNTKVAAKSIELREKELTAHEEQLKQEAIKISLWKRDLSNEESKQARIQVEQAFDFAVRTAQAHPESFVTEGECLTIDDMITQCAACYLSEIDRLTNKIVSEKKAERESKEQPTEPNGEN
jgi:hypothetical protein